MTDQASREGFEKHWPHKGDIKRHGENYEFVNINMAWEQWKTCWQAALTHANTEMEEMREALRDATAGLAIYNGAYPTEQAQILIRRCEALLAEPLPPTPQAGA